MCRLSIIVPYDRDEAAFETTLVSVLENRPEFCEVIVAHDGGYSDPFDLSDEVRFVVAESGDQVSLVRAAVAAAMGRVVHVLCGGARATEDWTEEPVSLFEQTDLACVAPVIRDLSAGGRIVAAGWRDTSRGLRRPIAAGAKEVGRREMATVEGVYLFASFWRRSTLDNLMQLAIEQDAGVADYAWAATVLRAGWRCRVATESTVTASPQLIWPSGSCVAAAQTMQQIRRSLRGEGLLSTCISAATTIASGPLAGKSWLEAQGRLVCSLGLNGRGRELAKQIRSLSKTMGPDAAQATILKIPTASPATTHRRAA